jgi:FkbM family methyltransferase
MRTIFSQLAENELKSAFLGHIERGYFVEVGAYRPELWSQTFDLEQRGWTGVLVEPQPQLAAELKSGRSAKVFAEACSARRNSGKRLELKLADGQSSLESKFNAAGVKSHGVIEVPVRTLDEILIEAGAPQLDFLSIDVEGHELDVIDGFDLARWRPGLILIEDLLLHLRLHRVLRRRGYRWVRRTGINNWYVPAENAPRLGFGGRWQFINKFYLGTPLRRLRMAWRRRNAVPRLAASRS